jgi:hypothetical protein
MWVSRSAVATAGLIAGMAEAALRSFLLRGSSQQGKKHFGVGVVRGDFNTGKRHHAHPWIFDLEPDQLRQFTLDLVGDTQGTGEILGHGVSQESAVRDQGLQVY